MDIPQEGNEHSQANPQDLDLACINAADDVLPRECLQQFKIDDCAEAMAQGVIFPPLIVFYDGQIYWLAEGFYRYKAAQQAGFTSFQAEVRAGARRDAMLHAIGANAAHGLPRTNADKRRVVLRLLNDPVWSRWSDHEIARRCADSQPMVSNLRRTVEPPQNTTGGASGEVRAIGELGDKDGGQPDAEGPTALNSVVSDNGYQIPRKCRARRRGHCYEMSTENIGLRAVGDQLSPEVRDLIRDTDLIDQPAGVARLEALSTVEQDQVAELLNSGEADTIAKARRSLRQETNLLAASTPTPILPAPNVQLLHGNCCEMLQHLPPQSVRLLLIDRPYGVNFRSNRRVASPRLRPLQGDESLEAALALLRGALEASARVMMKDCWAIVFSAWENLEGFRQVLREASYAVLDKPLNWLKLTHGMGHLSRPGDGYETMLLAWKGNPAMARRDSNIYDAYVVRREALPWHLTPKPTFLMKKMIEDYTQPGELVCDPFAGSGSTGLACLATGRAYFGVEIDAEYFYKATNRLNRCRQQLAQWKQEGRLPADEPEAWMDVPEFYMQQKGSFVIQTQRSSVLRRVHNTGYRRWCRGA